jgi:hypothetical protein
MRSVPRERGQADDPSMYAMYAEPCRELQVSRTKHPGILSHSAHLLLYFIVSSPIHRRRLSTARLSPLLLRSYLILSKLTTSYPPPSLFLHHTFPISFQAEEIPVCSLLSLPILRGVLSTSRGTEPSRHYSISVPTSLFSPLPPGIVTDYTLITSRPRSISKAHLERLALSSFFALSNSSRSSFKDTERKALFSGESVSEERRNEGEGLDELAAAVTVKGITGHRISSSAWDDEPAGIHRPLCQCWC